MLKRTPIPQEVVPFEVKKRRELLQDLKLWDGGIASITRDLGEERTKCGLSLFAEMPTSLKSPRMQALQAGINALSHWHSETLREYASLV
jgi:hypothetical protein